MTHVLLAIILRLMYSLLSIDKGVIAPFCLTLAFTVLPLPVGAVLGNPSRVASGIN